MGNFTDFLRRNGANRPLLAESPGQSTPAQVVQNSQPVPEEPEDGVFTSFLKQNGAKTQFRFDNVKADRSQIASGFLLGKGLIQAPQVDPYMELAWSLMNPVERMTEKLDQYDSENYREDLGGALLSQTDADDFRNIIASWQRQLEGMKTNYYGDEQALKAITDASTAWGTLATRIYKMTPYHYRNQKLSEAQQNAAAGLDNTDQLMTYYALLAYKEDFEKSSRYVKQESVPIYVTQEEGFDNLDNNQKYDARNLDVTADGKELVYEAVNGNWAASLALSKMDFRKNEDLAALNLSLAQSDGMDMTFLSEGEIRTFNYLYNTKGWKEAADFLNLLSNNLSNKRRAAFTEARKKEAEANPIFSSIESVVSTPFKGLINAAPALLDSLDGKITENAPYMYDSYAKNAVRGTVAEQLGGGFWGAAYQVGMSIADSATRSAISFGNPIVSGAMVAGDTYAAGLAAGKDRGLEDWQTIALAGIGTAAEIGAEYINFDALFMNPSLAKGTVKKYIVTNMTTNALEELTTDGINMLADVLISQDKSEWQMAVNAYKAAGKSDSEAWGLAIRDQGLSLLGSGLAGAVSGGVMAGGTAAMVGVSGNMPEAPAIMPKIDEAVSAEYNKRLEAAKKDGGVPDAVAIYSGVIRDLAAGKLTGYSVSAEKMAEVYTDYRLALAAQADLISGGSPIDTTANTAVEGEGDTGTTSIEPIDTALTAVRNGGNVTNSMAAAVLNNPEAISYLTERTGMELPHTASGRRNAVKQALTQLVEIDNSSPEPDFGAEVRRQIEASHGVGNQAAPEVDRSVSLAEQIRQENNQGGNVYGQSEYGPSGAAGGIGGGAGVPAGGQQRNAGSGAGEQAGGVGNGPAQPRKRSTGNGYQTTLSRQNRGKHLPKISSQELGLENGTDTKSIRLLPEELWDDEMSAVAERIYNETGKRVQYVLGPIQIRGANNNIRNARGVFDSDRIIVQADHSRLSISQIADHEAYHVKASPEMAGQGLNQMIRRHIMETFSEDELTKVISAYLEALDGVYGISEAATGEEFERLVWAVEEELFADAYAGINSFGAHAEQFTDAVNEKMDVEYLGKQVAQENGVKETTGPPVERYSVDDSDTDAEKNTADGGVKNYARKNGSMDDAEIQAVQSIGRKSVNAFTSGDIQKTEGLARRYWNEMGEKSPFFRAWFGDWRVNDQTPVQIANKVGDARGVQTNEDTGWNIQVSGKVFAESQHFASKNTTAMPYLPYINDIVNKAILLDSHGVSKGKSVNSLLMHSLYAVADIGNGPELLKLYVEEMNDPNSTGTTKRAYQLQNIERASAVNGGVQGNTPSSLANAANAIRTVADLFAAVKSKDASFTPKSVSKIVNNDGTPMVVYHGTSDRFTQFKDTEISSKEGSFFFAQNREDAEAYSGNGTVMKVYVNLQNPIDYNNMPTEIYRLKDKKAQVEALKKLGYDGWYCDMDTGWGEVSAFYPEQIKSATDNIGTFDGRNPDIRYSVDDADYSSKSDAKIQQELEAEQRRWADLWLRERLGDEAADAYLQRQKDAAKAAEERRIAESRQKAEQRKAEAKKKADQKTARNKRDREARKQKWEADSAKRTARKEADSRPTLAKRELRRSLLDFFSIPAGSRGEIATIIDQFADRLIRNGSLTEEDRKSFFDRMYQSGVMTVPADEMYKLGRGHISGGHIYVNDSVRADFGDDWNALRKRAFAAGVYLTTDPSYSGIDSWNSELAELFPGMFDSEETDLRSALERIVQIAEEGKDEKVSLPEYTARMAGIAHESEDTYLDHMERRLDEALRSFAQSAQLEIHLKQKAIKDREDLSRSNFLARQQLAQEREQRKEMNRRQQEQKELRDLQQRTLKGLQWLSKNRHRMPEDYRKRAEELLGDLDILAVGAANEMRWSDRYQATWRDAVQMYKDAKSNDPNFIPSEELERMMMRLDGEKIADLDAAALQDLFKAVVGLRTEYYNRNNVINDERNRLFSEVYYDAKEEIETAPGGYSGKLGDKFFNNDQLTPMNVLHRMGGWNPDGTFYAMAKQLEAGERDIRAFTVKAVRMLESFLTEHQDWVKIADGQGKDAIWYEMEVPELVQLGMGDKPIFGNTVKVYMTPSQKVHLYLESKNTDNLRHMMGGRTFVNKELYSQGKRQEALAQGTTIKLAPETVKKIVSDLTAEELELARVLEEYYNTFATGEINRVSNILYGYDKAMGKNYAPIFTNQNYTKSEFGVFDATAEGVGNLKERHVSKNPSYNISAFDAFERSVDQTARFVGMAIPARNWTTMMNWRVKNNSMADVITHKWGDDGKSYIENLLTTLQGGKDWSTDTISGLAGKLMSNYISATFGFNPSIVLKQLGSIPMASAYLGWENVPSVGQLNSIDRDLINKYSQDLAWRTMGYTTPETKQLKENPNWTQTNKFFQFTFGGGAITAMDGWAASTLWPWAENKVRREHPELEIGTQAQIDAGDSPFYKKVAEEFENAMSRSQSVSDEMHQGRLRKSRNPIAKAFTMFRSDSAQTYNTLRQKIGEARYYMRTGQSKDVVKAAKGAVGAAALAAVANAVWAEGISFLMALWKNKGKKYRDEEEELAFDSIAMEMVSNLAYSLAGISTGGEELAQVIGNLLTGEKIYDIEVPGMEQVNDIIKVVTESGSNLREIIGGAVNIAKNDGDLGLYFKQHSKDILGGVKATASATAMYFSGLPVNNVEAYLLGLVKWVTPELGVAYDDLFSTVNKAGLNALTGEALKVRMDHMLEQNSIRVNDDTLGVLAGLYEGGHTSVVPNIAPGKVTVNGEEHSLDNYQQQEYANAWNQAVDGALDELVASDAFKNADAQMQEKMLKALYDYGTAFAKAAVFEDFEVSSSVVENSEIVDAGASLAECMIWNKLTADMKGFEKAGLLAGWDMPEAAKRAIFSYKVSESREDAIAVCDEAGLDFDQFLEVYSKYGEFNASDMSATQKATEFAYWLDGQGYTSEQKAVIKDEIVYFNMTPASASAYEKFVDAGMDEEDAYELVDALDDLEPIGEADDVSDLQKWRVCVDFSSNVDVQLAALAGKMTVSQFSKVQVAYDLNVSPDTYISFRERLAMMHSDGSPTQEDIKRTINSIGGLDVKTKAILWQLGTGSSSTKNNPYSKIYGQQVLDALGKRKSNT